MKSVHAVHRIVRKRGIFPAEVVGLYEDGNDAMEVFGEMVAMIPAGSIVRQTDSEVVFRSGDWECWCRVEELPVVEAGGRYESVDEED